MEFFLLFHFFSLNEMITNHPVVKIIHNVYSIKIKYPDAQVRIRLLKFRFNRNSNIKADRDKFINQKLIIKKKLIIF